MSRPADQLDLEAETPDVLAPLALGVIIAELRRVAGASADTWAGRMALAGMAFLGVLHAYAWLITGEADLLLLSGACLGLVAAAVLA